MLCYVELVAPLSPPGHRRATCPTEDDWLWGRAKTKSRGAAPRLGGVSGCEDEYKRSPEDYLIIDLICLIYVPIYYGIYVYIYIHIFVVDVCSWFMYMLCTYIWYITYYIQYTSTKSLYIYIYIYTCDMCLVFQLWFGAENRGTSLIMSWKQQLWSESREVLKQLHWGNG